MPKSQSDLLAEISGIVTRVEVKQEEHAKVANKRLGKIEGLLEGNGQPGIKTRVDRLEQSEKKRAKGVWLGLAALVAAVGAWARDLVR